MRSILYSWLLLAALRTSSRSSRILPPGHDSSLRRRAPAVRVSRLWFSFSIEDAEERAGVLAHAVRSFLEILSAGRGEVVVPRAAVCFRHTPPRADELLLFEAMQCLIQRGAFDRDRSVGLIADVAFDAVAVHRTPAQRSENQNVDRALYEVRRFTWHPSLQSHDYLSRYDWFGQSQDRWDGTVSGRAGSAAGCCSRPSSGEDPAEWRRPGCRPT